MVQGQQEVRKTRPLLNPRSTESSTQNGLYLNAKQLKVRNKTKKLFKDFYEKIWGGGWGVMPRNDDSMKGSCI